ncbi:MAG TPA: serine hydrolase [Roseiflexaceae bacterium]|nr:serine hydrolase [Roseiflexaceae bacterium]
MKIRLPTPARPIRVLLWLLALLAAGCGQAQPAAVPSSVPLSPSAAVPSSVPISPSEGERYWPTDGWRTSPPEAQGMDPQQLAGLLQVIQQEHLNLHSLLIIRNGYIVSESYFQSYTEQTPHELYSVTKSVVATLVGIAIDKRSIDDVNQPLGGFFPNYIFQHPDERKDAIRLEHVLTMRTGLDWQEQDSTFRQMYQSRDWVQFMLNLPMREPPGQQFRYCSGCSHLLSAIVQQRTGMNTRDFAQQTLFDPLGIDGVTWEQDRQGTPIGGWGLQLTPRDMAKLGYLYLHDGMWDGQQVVSAAWVKAAIQQHTETDSELGLGYGYQWWTHPRLSAYAALGRDGQTIFVVPDLQLVIVTTAEMDGHEAIFKLIEQYILPAVRTT